MILASGTPLPLLSLVWPLALAAIAALPPVRPRAIRLLPLAPLPALWLALTGAGDTTAVPGLLLGVTLAAEPAGALLFAMTGTLWLAAAIYAQTYMAGTRKPALFASFWCLTLAGNLGVFLAADVVTFYVAFAAVSLAAYVLIVHEATEAALRAGRVYIVMVILGEVCLLAAFVIGISAADGDLGISEIRAALPGAPLGGLATVLLVAGFGIKAGLMPLHVWLPLAHPAAPTPASAVLSGAIVKAGIVGLILFLPRDMGISGAVVALGFAGAFGGALLGLLQSNPKAILAFSTVSQMSLLTALIASAAGGALAEAALYALHHGLAKGALFLSVGLVAACAGRWRAAALAAVALVALSVAGAPLTGGSIAKLAAKSGLEGLAETALTFSAATTTMVLAWFLVRLAEAEPGEGAGRPAAALALPTLAVGAAALAVPWILGPAWSGLEPGYPLHLSSLWSSAWPVAIGIAAAILWTRRRGTAPAARRRDATALVASLITTVRTTRIAAPAGRAQVVPSRATARSRAALEGIGETARVLEGRLLHGRDASLLLLAACAALVLGGWL